MATAVPSPSPPDNVCNTSPHGAHVSSRIFSSEKIPACFLASTPTSLKISASWPTMVSGSDALPERRPRRRPNCLSKSPMRLLTVDADCASNGRHASAASAMVLSGLPRGLASQNEPQTSQNNSSKDAQTCQGCKWIPSGISFPN